MKLSIANRRRPSPMQMISLEQYNQLFTMHGTTPRQERWSSVCSRETR